MHNYTYIYIYDSIEHTEAFVKVVPYAFLEDSPCTMYVECKYMEPFGSKNPKP